MDEFKDSKTALIADVDCTVHQDLCGTHGVEGYPTIKYGDPNNMEDYQGGRDLEDLQTFAKENLGPSCGPNNLDLCDEEAKKTISDAQALSDADLDAKIKRKRVSSRRPRRPSRARSRSCRRSTRSSRRRRMPPSPLSRSPGLGHSSRSRLPRPLARRSCKLTVFRSESCRRWRSDVSCRD